MNQGIIEERKFKLDDPYAIDTFESFDKTKKKIDKKQKGRIAIELELIIRICENLKQYFSTTNKIQTIEYISNYESNVNLFKEFFMGRITLEKFLENYEPLGVLLYSEVKNYTEYEWVMFEVNIQILEKSISLISYYTSKKIDVESKNLCVEAYTYLLSPLIGIKGAIELHKRCK